jgi:hypothetical protein|tara:strand:+ start:81 stop:956 length:876 start_codon:yes stop_codon:yes gene_type:complete
MSYNKDTSRKYGWEPSWFGADDFGPELDQKVKEFQRSLGITADGLVGPSTYRRIFAHREANIDDYEPSGENIVYNGKFFPINWKKVVLWDEPHGLEMNKGTYSDYSGKEPRDISMFVNHWDVCLSSKSCADVLNKRKVSVQFCIDNDGTIYQLADMQHACWHAGSRTVNHKSVGVEISNAFYLKYQDWYTKRFGPRPIIDDAVVHGKKLETHLGFYPIQIEALKALWEAVSNACDIPLEAPTKNGELDTGENKDVSSGQFEGFVNHYNITARKIDCAGLDLVKLLNEVKAD